jgi:hypothetical protein
MTWRDIGRHVSSERFLSTAAAALMSAAALGTSWSSFQSTMWGQRQQDAAIRAGQARLHATTADMQAMQTRTLDVGLFSSWLNASKTNHAELASIYVARFRPEFRPAFNAWMATHPFQNPQAPPSPFGLKEYHLALDDVAELLSKQAEVSAGDAAVASARSAEYMLNTVVFAIVLFFAGTTHDASRHRATRIFMLGIALAAAILATSNLVRYPRTGRLGNADHENVR